MITLRSPAFEQLEEKKKVFNILPQSYEKRFTE